MNGLKKTFPISVLASLMVTTLAGPAAASDHGHHLQDDASAGKDTNVLELITRHPPLADADAHYEFVLSDETIPSGWTTIRMSNHSSSTHFAYIARVPDHMEDITTQEFIDDIATPFHEAWMPYYEGEVDVETMFGQLFSSLPEWYAESVPIGGPGFTGGGITSSTTLNLSPGTYFIDCYVMDDDGVFHTMHGMVERLVVTDEQTDSTQPAGDIQVRISSTEGLRLETEAIQPGPTSFEVTFEDNVIYANGLGHDVHLLRLDGDTTVQEINRWMDLIDVGEDGYYADRGGLVSASGHRGPQTFLGGVQTVFANPSVGETFPVTAYFHTDLTPGRYVLVAETSNPMQPDPENPDMTMLVEFSVTPFAGLTGAWYDPATAGEGWNFVATPGGMFGYFYGYGDNGNPLWLITEEVIGDITAGEPVTFNLLNGEGGAFAAPVMPDNLHHWGEVTFTFENCNEATAEMSGADGTASHELVRVTETAGLAGCGF